MNQVVYVVGHKNPDTDSICAAMCYAKLKQISGNPQTIAARAGHINPQTEFVLTYLKIAAAIFISDVTPKVEHAMTDEVIFYHKETSLKEILQKMEEVNIRQIPIVDDEQRYWGMVSLFNIAHEFCREANPQGSRKIFTSIKHLQQAIEGELICANPNEEAYQGVFIVGAMEEVSFKQVLATIDPKMCLVITGDRDNIQQAAIEHGVRTLIVTGGFAVSSEISQKANAGKVNLLISPYDTATTVGLVRLSTPAYSVIKGDESYLLSDEYLIEARQKILTADNRGMVVLDDQQQLVGIITRADLLRFSKTKLILVDHNEISQAVDGAEQAEIMEIIDHHRLANPQTLQPIMFINQPVGSSCTLVAKIYFEMSVEIDHNTAVLLLSGIISDTLNLKSPTTTILDKQMLEKLNQTAKLDLPEYSSQLLAAGASLKGREPREIILNDFKEYNIGRISLGIGQLEVVGFTEFDKVKPQILEQLRNIRQNRGFHFTSLMVTDIATSRSLLVFDGDRTLSRRIGYPIIEPHVIELKGVLSRKKQLLPHLLSVFKES